MNKSEKRYFKLISQAQGSDQNYLQLFDALDQMDTYRDDLLRKRFNDYPFTNQLSVAKNYLGKLIMKSLRSYHQQNSLSAQIRAALTDVEILFKRDLLNQSYRALLKAERLAIKSGVEHFILEVINWKRKLLLNLKDRNKWKPELDSLVLKEQELLCMLENESNYWALTLGIDREIGGGMENLLKHSLLLDDNSPRSYRGNILYYHLVYIKHTIAGQSDQADQTIDKLLTFLEENEIRLRDDPGPYITALNNKIGIYLNQQKYARVHAVLRRIRQLPAKLKLSKNNPVSLKILVRTFNVELETYRDSGEYSRGVRMIPEVQSYIEDNWDFIATDYKVLLYYQFAYLYFMTGDFSNALKNINKVLDHRHRGVRVDIIGYAQFLNLIIHYELGNNTVMKYAVDACRRYLKKRGKLLEFERVLLRLFSQLSTRPVQNHKRIFLKCYQQLFQEQELINDSQLDYLNFKTWLEGKGSFIRE